MHKFPRRRNLRNLPGIYVVVELFSWYKTRISREARVEKVSGLSANTSLQPDQSAYALFQKFISETFLAENKSSQF